MMWGNGYGMHFVWWIWPVGLALVLGVVLLTIVTIRVFTTGSGASGPQGNPSAGPDSTGRSAARLLLDERFARGELDAEEYRHRVQVLGE